MSYGAVLLICFCFLGRVMFEEAMYFLYLKVKASARVATSSACACGVV